MSEPIPLFDLAPGIDRAASAAAFASDGRAQVRNVLTDAAADSLHHVLARGTDWGIGWGGEGESGASLRGAELRGLSQPARAKLGNTAGTAARQGTFGFVYARYPMIEAYREGWDPGHPLELVLEHLNATPIPVNPHASTLLPAW